VRARYILNVPFLSLSFFIACEYEMFEKKWMGFGFVEGKPISCIFYHYYFRPYAIILMWTDILEYALKTKKNNNFCRTNLPSLSKEPFTNSSLLM
jgi:hypothetical protein